MITNVLWQLSDMSGVEVNLLAENAELFSLVKKGLSIEALLDWINENY